MPCFNTLSAMHSPLTRIMLGTSMILLAMLAHATDIPSPLTNQLRLSPSPYLAAHANDPVAWQEWNHTTIERARAENKLLYLSIGYFSCHWCHVMQAESYRNPEIAAIINQNFIPVKIDRELNMALDAQMIEFAESRLKVSGWPLNVFVTPEGHPLYALLYQPPETFIQMLAILAKEWQKDSAGLKAIAHNGDHPQAPPSRIRLERKLSVTLHTTLIQETLAQADMLAGGLNVPRKFPLAPQLAVLLQMEKQQHDTKLAEWLSLTLDRMIQGGLRDHIGGGFFRYTTDPAWQRPHFEKMLYDNAQLASLYLQAADILKHPPYRQVAIQTLDFMMREMLQENGMITSLSAVSSSGIEGEAYLWNESQLKTQLSSKQLALVKKIWGLSLPPEYDAGYLPLFHALPDADETAELQAIHETLLQARQTRVIPRDTKLLASLNGLALAAFSQAAPLAPRFQQTAEKLRNFVVSNLHQDGKLSKGNSNQRDLGPADLDAYAYVIYGLQQYALQPGKQSDATLAVKLAGTAWQLFFNEKHGFTLEQQDEWGRKYYQPFISDSPLPSPSALLIQSSIASGDRTLLKHARAALALSAPPNNHDVFWNATQITAINQLFQIGDDAR